MPPCTSNIPDEAVPRCEERGFGLVEIIVVLVVLSIVGAVALHSLTGTKRNAAETRARTVARTLGEAVEQFRRDRGGRLPAAPGTALGSADWGGSWRSPVDVSNANRPYASAAALEGVGDRVVALENASGAVAPGGAGAPARLRYVVNQNAGFYAFVVRVRTGSSYTAKCYVTNATRTGSGTSFIAGLGASKPC